MISMSQIQRRSIHFSFLMLLGSFTSCGLQPEFNGQPLLSPPVAPLEVKGCKNSLALNFNLQAEEEDGSCIFKGCTIFDASFKENYDQYRAKYPLSTLEDTCPAKVSDLYNQQNRPHVGILWVVDNSFSMEPEQKNLANNFGSFINEFTNSRIEFTMGITTTDSKSRPEALTQLTSDAANSNRTLMIQNFKKLINVGINGSSSERGYHASYQFLEQNAAKLLRLDSYLSIIYVSDEKDQSKNSPQSYLDHMISYAGSLAKVRTHAIVDLDNSGEEDSSYGERYLYTVHKTGGIKGDVDGNFSKILKDIASNINNLKNMFRLSKIPYVPSLKVTLNGQLSNSWSYQSAENAILINPIPDFKTEIQIEYTPQP